MQHMEPLMMYLKQTCTADRTQVPTTPAALRTLYCCCLAVIAVMLPTLLSSTADAITDFSAELALSRFESVLMLLCYGLFLVFQLVTHRLVSL